MTNATWRKNPADGNYNNDANWTGGTVPDGTAIFGKSSVHSLTISADTSVGGWTFNSGNYVVEQSITNFLLFDGKGIVIKTGSLSINVDDQLEFHSSSSASKTHFTVGGFLWFLNSSTASHAKIINNSSLEFWDTATAGRAIITNTDILAFNGASSAGHAHISSDNGSTFDFVSTSTAGAAAITLHAGSTLRFFASSKAGSASITNNATTHFLNSSSADHATIANNAALLFQDTSTAGNAVIATMSGAETDFLDGSNGGTARLITKAGGTVDFSAVVGPIPATPALIAVGSIEGGGAYKLGTNILILTSNRSTTVSGSIDGGVLVKEGGRTLTLSHAGNAYSGTNLADGTLHIAAQGAAGSGDIDFLSGRQTLKVEKAAFITETIGNQIHHLFVNQIDNFAAGDVIDLAGVRFVAHAKATYDSGDGSLTVKSGKVIDVFTLDSPQAFNFKAADDGHGGTKVTLVLPHAKSVAPIAETAPPHGDHRSGDLAPHESVDGFRLGGLDDFGGADVQYIAFSHHNDFIW
jgi:fibronectin-binding autotransporter adhesin